MLQVVSVRCALAAVAALAAVPAAHAADAAPVDQRSQAVSFHDLDLSTAKGRNALHWRMRVAAQSVCGYDGGRKSLSEMAAERDCYDRAMHDADVQIAAIVGTRTVAVR